jgi:phosphoribosylpyrophosphate synthetase
MSIRVYVGGVKLPYEVSRFPAGELGVTLGELPNVEFSYSEQEIDLGWLFQSSEEFIIMSLLLDSLRTRYTERKYTLHIPYFPSSRADRDTFFNYQLGVPQQTSFGLRVYADLLKAMNFDLIVTDDPHSNVLAGMFPSGLLSTTSLSQSVEKIMTVLHESLGDLRDYNLIFVAPDSGAEKKVYECSVVATKLLKEKYDYVGDVQMLIGDKSRDVSGKIVSHTIE